MIVQFRKQYPHLDDEVFSNWLWVNRRDIHTVKSQMLRINNAYKGLNLREKLEIKKYLQWDELDKIMRKELEEYQDTIFKAFKEEPSNPTFRQMRNQ